MTSSNDNSMIQNIQMESDFVSTFLPNVNMTYAERIVKQADDFCRQVRGSLGPNVEGPPELLVLEQAVEESFPPTMTTTTTTGDDSVAKKDKDDNKAEMDHSKRLARLMYELMIECGLQFDKDPDTGIMTPTQFDNAFIQENLDLPEIKDEFFHLYTYGLQLISMNVLTLDEVRDIAQTRIIPRSGLDPPAFDAWLGF